MVLTDISFIVSLTHLLTSERISTGAQLKTGLDSVFSFLTLLLSITLEIDWGSSFRQLRGSRICRIYMELVLIVL